MRNTKLLHVLWLVIWLILPATIQADIICRIDSLLNTYEQVEGKEKRDIGKQLLDIYAKADVFFSDAPTLSEQMPTDSINLIVWFGTERYFTTKSYYDKALPYNEMAMKLAKEGDTDIHATLLCDRAYCLFKQTEYSKSIAIGQEAARLSLQTKNWMQLSRAYLYMAIVNHSMRDYETAKQQIVKAIDTNNRLGINIQTHNVLGVACEIFCSAKEVDKAIEYGQQAVEAARAIEYQPGVANHLTQLSYAYDRKGEFQKGLEAAEQAIDIVQGIEPLDRNQLAISLEFKSWNLLDLGRNREAADVLRQAIALEEAVGNMSAVRYDYRTLCEALEPIDMNEAMKALKICLQMSDSIHSAQLNEAMGKANAELRNDELEEENAQNRRMNRIILSTSIIIITLLVIAIGALWFASRQKSRTDRTLRQTAKLRESFFNNVAHEFKTRLTQVSSLAKGIQDAPSNTEELAKTSHSIEEKSTELQSLVTQMLDISKVKSAIDIKPQKLGKSEDEEDVEAEPMTDASREFIERVHASVRELMPRGEADVEHLASELCMSTSQLRRKMTSITGTPPKQYIVGIQLATARDMLAQHPERTTTDIAERCGFYDPSHFTKAFRNAYGITPGQYQMKLAGKKGL